MHVQDHSTIREGVVTGAIGGVIVAVWYLLVDTASGRPFHTPNLVGKIFFRGDLAPGVRQAVVVAFGLFAGLTYMLGTRPVSGSPPGRW